MNKRLLFSAIILVSVIFGIVFMKFGNGININLTESLQSGNPPNNPIQSNDQVTLGNNGEVQEITIGLGPDRYYSPKDIRVKAGTKIRLYGDAKTLTGCMRTVIVENYGSTIAGSSPLEFVADKPGTYQISCSMGMGGGRLLVEDSNGNVPGSSAPVTVPQHSCSGGGGCGGGCGGY